MQRIYSIWCSFWFLIVFLFLFPFFFLFLQNKKWHSYAHYLNRLWAQIYFPLCGLKLDGNYKFLPDASKAYVFCANHSSFLDIAAMGLVLKNFYAFVGKKSISKIPLFGYMFTKLHIAVDRESNRSAHETMKISLEMLKNGRSIVIFPEGGIKTKNPPFMSHKLKDGAIRMAIITQVPIVPISFPDNWLILPDDGKLLFKKHKLRYTVHEPIQTIGLTLNDVEFLTEKVKNTITQELIKYYPEKYTENN